MHGPRVSEVETDEFIIKFYASHISFHRNERRPGKVETWVDGHWRKVDGFNTVNKWFFDVEEKEYTDSNHRTKISYSGQDMIRYNPKKEQSETNHKKANEIKLTVEDFVNKLMINLKPTPRFSLKDTKIPIPR